MDVPHAEAPGRACRCWPGPAARKLRGHRPADLTDLVELARRTPNGLGCVGGAAVRL